jgi:hypothetical protein
MSLRSLLNCQGDCAGLRTTFALKETISPNLAIFRLAPDLELRLEYTSSAAVCLLKQEPASARMSSSEAFDE